MRNILALLALAVLLVGGVGWYLGWYQMESEPASEGHRKITIDINSPKIGQDLDRGKARLHELLDSKKPAAAPAASSTPATTKPSTASNLATGPGPAGAGAPASSSTAAPASTQPGRGTSSQPVEDNSWIFPAEQESAPPVPPLPAPPR